MSAYNEEYPVKLNYRTYGKDGDALIILHGLFGSSNNWQSIARDLSPSRYVITPDLRNHGRSPWADSSDYPSMVKDLVELIGEQPFESADIMGHSMGGKTAMLTALMHPELVEHLIVVDIVPKEYPPFHREYTERSSFS